MAALARPGSEPRAAARGADASGAALVTGSGRRAQPRPRQHAMAAQHDAATLVSGDGGDSDTSGLEALGALCAAAGEAGPDAQTEAPSALQLRCLDPHHPGNCERCVLAPCAPAWRALGGGARRWAVPRRQTLRNGAPAPHAPTARMRQRCAAAGPAPRRRRPACARWAVPSGAGASQRSAGPGFTAGPRPPQPRSFRYQAPPDARAPPTAAGRRRRPGRRCCTGWWATRARRAQRRLRTPLASFRLGSTREPACRSARQRRAATRRRRARR